MKTEDRGLKTEVRRPKTGVQNKSNYPLWETMLSVVVELREVTLKGNASTYQQINISKYQRINASTYQQINISKYQRINVSTYQRINILTIEKHHPKNYH